MNEKQNALMAVAVGAVVLGLSTGGFFLALNAKKTAEQNAEVVEQLRRQLVALQVRAEDADGKITGVVELVKSVVELNRKAPAVEDKPAKGKVTPQEQPAAPAVSIDAPKADQAPPSTTENGRSTLALAELLSEVPKAEGAIDVVTPDKVDGLLVERISNNWHRPASAKNGMQVTIEIQMARTGAIKQVKVKNGSGDEAFDRSAVVAIQDVKSVPEIARLSDEEYRALYLQRTVIFTPESLGK